MESPLWCIKYRPRKWEDFVGQDNAINELRRFAETKTCPHMIFIGPPGTGKTAAVELFAREFLGADFDANYLWLNVRDLRTYPVSKAKRSIQALAKVDRSQRTQFDEYMSVVYKEAKEALRRRGKSGDPNRSEMLHQAIKMFASTLTVTTELVKIMALDEADALDNNMQQALRRTMEIYSDACRFILVTPTLAGWIPAILSRCIVVRFQPIPEADVKHRISEIASAEGVEIGEVALTAIARECNGNMRRAINVLQMAAAKSEHVSEDDVYDVSETPLTKAVRELVTLAINGSFVKSRDKMRKLLAIEQYSPSEVLREIQHDILRRPFDDATRIALLERIAVIDNRMHEGKNAFIHLGALLASIWYIASAESSA
ncbi:MAG: AAA family ATPase [Candidatus Thorarchaeota archaeon]